MKNKILKIILAILLTINIGEIFYYEHDSNIKQEMISKLQHNVKTKSTKIAKLDSVIKLKNEKIIEQQKVIDNNYNVINELEQKARKIQDDYNKLLAENFRKSQEGSGVGVQYPVVATAYTPHCSEGCTGITATGVNVSKSIYYQGHRVIAVDTKLIPLNSLVKVETETESFTAMAIDTGGAIHGHIIDVLVGNTRDAIKFGRQKATVTILKRGQ